VKLCKCCEEINICPQKATKLFSQLGRLYRLEASRFGGWWLQNKESVTKEGYFARDQNIFQWSLKILQDYRQSRIQSNACARARMALALGKLNFFLCCDWFNVYQSCIPVVNFPRANAIHARAQALLWVRDWIIVWRQTRIREIVKILLNDTLLEVDLINLLNA
jgi:hypothetical protein